MNWEEAYGEWKKVRKITNRSPRIVALIGLGNKLGVNIPKGCLYLALLRKVELAVRVKCIQEKGIALGVVVVKTIGPSTRGPVSHVSARGLVSIAGQVSPIDPAKLRVVV